MGNHVCDNSNLVIQVTGHGHDNPKKQPQQLMFYKDDYKTPLENIKAQETTTKLREDKYPSNYECPSILFEYPECEVKGTQLAIKIPTETGGEIILPLLDKVEGGTTERDKNLIYKSHRLLAIVPIVTMSTISSTYGNYTALKNSSYLLSRSGYFYVFIDSKLWREVKIEYQQDKPKFKDVDLKQYENIKGFREATGKALDDIWIPATFPKRGFQVQVAYSEEQWTWERINYLESNQDKLQHRCNMTVTVTSIVKPNTNGIPFSLTSLKPHRPRDFETEMMLDNPHSYLTNLGEDYLKNVAAVNQNAFAACSKKETYAIFDVKDYALHNKCCKHFETGAWLSILYRINNKDSEELAKVAEFWPIPDNDYTIYQEKTPEADSLQNPQQKVEDALESFKQRYILGVYVQDPLYDVHHLQQRISSATMLLQKMPQLALDQKRPHPFLGSLVNSQRRYFKEIDHSLAVVGKPVQQNFAHSICEVERLAIIFFAERCQNILTNVLEQPITNLALADLLSDHTPINYAGHLLFIITALKAVAYPIRNYDELSYTSFTDVSAGQKFINLLRERLDRGLHKLIETQKTDEEIIQEVENYVNSSTEPTDNPGDGSFRISVLKELNKQLQSNTYTKPTAYNGEIFEEVFNKLDKEVLSESKAKQQQSAEISTIVTGLKYIAFLLTSMQMMLFEMYEAAHKAAANAANIIKTQVEPHVKVATKAEKIRPIDTESKNLQVIQTLHAKTIYSLREIIPDLFRDMCFVPMEKNGVLLNSGNKGDYLIAVDNIAKQIMGRNITNPEYSSKVRLIKIKAGSQLHQLMWAIKNANPFPKVGGAMGAKGYEIAAEQVWQDYFKSTDYELKNFEGEATNIAKMRQTFIDTHQEDIIYRAFLNRVDAEIDSGNILDYGQGELKKVLDQNLNQTIKTEVADIKRNAEIEIQQGTQASSAQQKTAATIMATDEAKMLENLLRSKYAAGLFLAFEIWNIQSFRAGFQDLKETRNGIRVVSGIGSVSIDSLNASLLLMERTALNHKQWITNVLKTNLKGITIRSSLGVIGLVLTVGNGLSDVYYELTEGHPERAVLNAIIVAGAGMMIFSGKLAAASVLIGVGPVGWLVLGLAVIIGASIGLAAFQPSQMQDWLKQGPYADTTAEWFPLAKGHLSSSEEAYYRFLSMIAGISVKVEINELYKERLERLDNNTSEADKRKQQAKFKVTVSSNLPGLANMQPRENTKVELQASFRPLAVGGRIGRTMRTLYEETTPNGKILYLDYKFPKDAWSCQIDVWAQFAADINYFGVKERRYFPAPPPNEDIKWEEKYNRPNKQADSTPFWYFASFDFDELK